jgi:hypothetical protein
MSDRKKELDEFEMHLRSLSGDPAVKMFLDLIKGMSEDAKYDALEKQKNIMKIVDTLSTGLRHILSTEKGERLFREELKKRSGQQS